MLCDELPTHTGSNRSRTTAYWSNQKYALWFVCDGYHHDNIHLPTSSGGFYDFTSDLSSKDTAYTSIALDVHTDTTYFTEPAGLQAFHLLSHEGGEGGSSQLADGFRAAEILRVEHPKAFEVLRDFRFWTHASGNDGISIQPHDSVTVIEAHPESNEIFRVRWNSSDRSAFIMDSSTVDRCRDWYEAAGYVHVTESGQAAH